MNEIRGEQIKALPDELVLALVKYQNNQYGVSPLHAAIMEKDEKAVRLFLENGTDANSRTNGAYLPGPVGQGGSALAFAIAYGNITLINLLIDSGAKIDGDLNLDSSPVTVAAICNNIPAIECLVKRGAKQGERIKI